MELQRRRRVESKTCKERLKRGEGGHHTGGDAKWHQKPTRNQGG